jgi:hypothetical protein
MSAIDPQTTQQIVQFLSTYGNDAGIAAAGAIGAGTVQILGSGAKRAIKSLWDLIRHKSKQEGGIAEEIVNEFEADPHEQELQQTFSYILRTLSDKDSAFANELTQLFNEVQRDSGAAQFMQHISGNAQVGMAGVNYGHVTINQTTHPKNSMPQHQLQIKLTIGIYSSGKPPVIPTLLVHAINVGTLPSYVDRIEFESNVDGQLQVNGVLDFGKSQRLHKFGQAIQPGQKHTYFYFLQDLGELSTLGRVVIPVSVHLYDEIGNLYQAPISKNIQEIIMNYYPH